MKLILIMASILVSGLLKSQIVQTLCDADYQPVSTNWSSPSNSKLPLTNGSRYLNQTNWNQNSFPLPNMAFNNINLGPKTSLSNSQLGPYYDYIYLESPAHAHLPSEGWELLLVNVGKYPDNTTLTESSLYSALPYVVLYNKFKGLIRVFVGMGPDADISNSADALSIELFFTQNTSAQQKLTGLLRLYEGHDQALDQPTDVKSTLSIGKAVSELSRWASVDFQIAYDPCTCKTPSIMGLLFTHIKEQSLSLYGREVAITDNDIMTNEMAVNPKDFLSSVNYDQVTSDASEGLIISKALASTIEDYEIRYQKYQTQLAIDQEHNDKVNNNLAILKFAKYAYSAASTLSGGLTSNLLPLILENAGASYALDYLGSANYNAWGATVDDADWFKRSVNGIQGIIKKVDGQYDKLDEKKLFDALKQILGEDADTFITNNFETKPEPTAPEQPTNSITYSEMKFDGKIITKTNKIGPTFFTPGTYGTLRGNTPTNNPLNNWDDVFQYPVYNDVLGTFALLESPKINISKTVANDIENTILQRTQYLNNGHYSVYLYRYQAWTKQYQIQLKNPLKFVFNPVLDIKNYSIQAAYEVTVKPKKITTATTSTISNSFVDPNHLVNIEVLDVPTNKFEPLIAGNNAYHYGHGIPSPYFNFGLPVPEPTIFNASVKNITPYLPLDAFKPLVSEVGIRNEAINGRYIDVSATPSSLPNLYNFTTLSDGSVYFTNTNVFPQPITSNPADFGYEYDIEVKLKLIVDIEFNSTNSNGAPNTTTLALTYPINNSDITFLNNDIVPNLETSNSNIFQYKENLLFEDIDFHGQQVEGCKLTGNTYTCTAWNNITVNGDITTNNYAVYINAGNEVVVSDESNISPFVVLQIQPILDYSQPIPLSDQTFVTAFCNGVNGQAPQYKANQPSAKVLAMIEAQEALSQEQEIANASWDFDLFPNPATNRSSIRVNSRSALLVGITVTDVSGKSVLVKVSDEGENNHSIDLTNCQKGIYFVTVSSYGGSQTKQLIVQ
jgi:Secretion system C-terminal sorting domain